MEGVSGTKRGKKWKLIKYKRNEGIIEMKNTLADESRMKTSVKRKREVKEVQVEERGKEVGTTGMSTH